MSNEINPVSYGKLIGKVDSLESKVESLEKDIKELLELANRGRGGFWAGMTIASFLGGLFTFIANHWLGR